MELYLNDHMSDIVFYIGGISELERPVRFAAHKCVVTFASPVFAKMLANDKFSEGKRGEIKIIDVTPSAFNALLHFAYTSKLNQQPTSEYQNILYAAEKYSMDNLKLACFQQLSAKQINIDNFWSFWIITKHYFSEQMSPTTVEATNDFLSEEALQILENADFENISHPLLSSIIESNFLTFVDEIVIFNCVLRWAKMECCRQGLSIEPLNLRKVLGDVVYKIRYLLMSSIEMTNGPIKSQILSPEDEQLLLREKKLENQCLLLPPWNSNLLRKPRELETAITWDLEEVSTEETQRNNCSSVTLAFSCNLVLSTVEFSVLPDVNLEVEIECSVSHLNGEVFKICVVKKSYKSDEEISILVEIPVCLKSFTGYQLKVICIKGLLSGKHYIGSFWDSDGQKILYIGGFPSEIVSELFSVKYWKSAFDDKTECVYRVWKTPECLFGVGEICLVAGEKMNLWNKLNEK